MTVVADTATWDAELRPHRMPRLACIAAVIIVAVHVTFALLLKVKSSGVVFQTSDQVAFAGLGIVLAGAVLLLTRPRLRVGPQGLSVRNVLGDKFIAWRDVRDVSFHDNARWARADLAADEYIPVMAIQVADKSRAVEAMDTVRDLMEKYRPASAPD